MAAPDAARSDGSGRRLPDVTLVEFAESEVRRTTLVVIGILLILAIALATYFGVKHSVREMRGVNMQSRLDAELRALHVWVAQRSNVVERWAEDERTRALVQALLARAGAGAPPEEALCRSPAAQQLRELLQPALEVRRFVTFDVIDRSGLIVVSHEPGRCGRRVSTGKFLALLDRTFSGKTSFLRPFRDSQRLAEGSEAQSDAPQVWFEAPVRDARGRPVAALGFAEPAYAEFAALLRGAGAGETDEVYLFDSQGLMLTDSRHAAKIAAAGLIDAAPSGHTMLQLHAREPGRDGEARSRSAAEQRSQPLTRLAARAIASQEGIDPAGRRGVLLEPYRNYLGTEVVGAWLWLPEYGFGAALEIDAEEAYAPVKFLERAFAVVLGLSAAAMVGIVIALWTDFSLRRRLHGFRRLGHYRLIREIGEGGMASIYLGRHALLKRPIAIKILKRALANEEMIARFEREVQAASQLTHPNAVAIFDYGRTRSGDFYYVMEYLDGITLAALVERDGALPPERAIHLLRQVCAALREAHARGIVHRDIKPENVMACERGGEYDVVKILDFGLVKSMHDEVSRDVTGSIKVLGTPAYMAPERFADAAGVDERSDVYSIGAVAYLLLAGKRIFHDASGEDLQLRIQHTAVRPPSENAGRPIPPALEQLVLDCLAKQPQSRPASVAQVLGALEQLARTHPWTQAQAQAWWQDYARTRETSAQESV
jgi:serine/threonine-protein kinase